jgi:hypothetical protein
MKTTLAILSLGALLALGLSACDSGLDSGSAGAMARGAGDEEVLGKKEKVLVCHVGSELPAYDPACTEGCGDAGKVDLISVPVLARHIGHPGHAFGGVADFEPLPTGATGIASEDSDGDGIDDGCEVDNSRPIGTITASIFRGGVPPGSDRGVESAAGNLVAEAQWWATSGNGAQIAFMNPGGVRSDLLYPQSAGEGDGVVTLGEAFTFQPFGNTLVTIPMTGAQIVAALSEQCQPPGSNRPFLHLGVSTGFTYDLSATIVGGDCTAISVTNLDLNGTPIDPAVVYQVTVNNFLADGGDNFATFATVDPSLRQDGGNDLAALLAYFVAFSPVAPPGTDRVTELP